MDANPAHITEPAGIGSVSKTLARTKPRDFREQAMVLRIVDVFLTQIELTLLIPATASNDFTSLKRDLDALSSRPEDAELKADVDHKLERWRKSLTRRDERIEAYQMRRYCDGVKIALDKEILLAMARFYREQPYSRNSLSKFDMMLTRAFSSKVGDFRHCLVADREGLAEMLAERFDRWGRAARSSASEETAAVAAFDRFIDECFSIEKFDQFSESGIFERVREYKASLGDGFFVPTVIAAAIECNIALGNRLNVLISEAARELGERLGSEFDLAGALQDTTPNAGVYIKELLRELDEIENARPEQAASGDMDVVRTMLDLAATDAEEQDLGDIDSIPMPQILRSL